jgi:hypothetical protein
MSKSAKALQNQARTAERIAYQNASVSGEIKTPAGAFRAQAEVLKKKRKKKQ